MSAPQTNLARDTVKATAAKRAQADAFAAKVLPIIAAIKAEGIETNTGISAVLNERGILNRPGIFGGSNS
ncbi:hypothetical protein ACRAWG_10180 [Methylobacterium sp. P31]